MSERNPREKRITTRLVHQGEEEREFDAQFWREMDPNLRVEALWDMVLELRAIKGLEGDEPRLQRSVSRIERI
jgi:hypothetical protein